MLLSTVDGTHFSTTASLMIISATTIGRTTTKLYGRPFRNPFLGGSSVLLQLCFPPTNIVERSILISHYPTAKPTRRTVRRVAGKGRRLSTTNTPTRDSRV
uniref:Uncharacterized protein n=1 Tax=Anopheles atroparvus TaxID=41427 RepID=A0AAG5D312_ANOAO